MINATRAARPLIEYIPLQQGLRHLVLSQLVYVAVQLIEYIPLQQGLRLLSCLSKSIKLILIEYIPLQQGLRHCLFFRFLPSCFPH